MAEGPILADHGSLSRGQQERRAAAIDRFAAKQRRKRQFINFAEIAEWCSREDGSILHNPEKRAAAYDALAADLVHGDFQCDGRSQVLFLHPTVQGARMTPDWMKIATEGDLDGLRGMAEYLPYCWIPRALFERWLAKHRLTPTPVAFEAIVEKKLPRP